MKNEIVPLRNGKPWNYCSKCGERMKWSTAGYGYDREDGSYGPNFSWRCPDWAPGDRSKSHDIANTTVRDPSTTQISQ